MDNAATQEPNRLDRRKARTRAALIRAAQTLIAEGRTNVPILEITQAADVGMGSFYNHFESKDGVVLAVAEDFSNDTLTARYQAEPGDVRGAVKVLVGDYERYGDANVRWAMTSERL